VRAISRKAVLAFPAWAIILVRVAVAMAATSLMVQESIVVVMIDHRYLIDVTMALVILVSSGTFAHMVTH
jgi:hypothetical protein